MHHNFPTEIVHHILEFLPLQILLKTVLLVSKDLYTHILNHSPLWHNSGIIIYGSEEKIKSFRKFYNRHKQKLDTVTKMKFVMDEHYTEEEIDDLKYFTNLTELHLNNFKSKVDFDDGLTKLQKLKKFSLTGYASQNAIAKLTNLTELYLKHIDQLNGITTLQNLRKLSLVGNVNQNGLAQFTTLNVLNLHSNSENLSELRNLSKLTVLGLFECQKLNTLDPVSQLIYLTELKICRANGIQNLDSLKTLRYLTKLKLKLMRSLESLDGISRLTRLTDLNLQYLRVYDIEAISHLTNLRTLKMKSCHNFREIPGLEYLTRLTSLTLYNCRWLERLDEISLLTNLTKVDLYRCEKLQDVDKITKLTYLTKRKFDDLE